MKSNYMKFSKTQMESDSYSVTDNENERQFFSFTITNQRRQIVSIITTSKRSSTNKASFLLIKLPKKNHNQNIAEKANMSDDEALESEMLDIEIPELKGRKMSKDKAGEEGKDEKADADGESEKGNICQKITT